MINKNALVYGALFFSCTPFMIAHAKYGDEIPFQIKAYIEAETCSLVTEGSDQINISLPDIPLGEVEEMYKKNTTKTAISNRFMKFICANGKTARFSVFYNNTCSSIKGPKVGCLADNPSLGFQPFIGYYAPPDNKYTGITPSDIIRNATVTNGEVTFSVYSNDIFPIQGKIPAPGVVGAVVTLRIWSE